MQKQPDTGQLRDQVEQARSELGLFQRIDSNKDHRLDGREIASAMLRLPEPARAGFVDRLKGMLGRNQKELQAMGGEAAGPAAIDEAMRQVPPEVIAAARAQGVDLKKKMQEEACNPATQARQGEMLDAAGRRALEGAKGASPNYDALKAQQVSEGQRLALKGLEDAQKKLAENGGLSAQQRAAAEAMFAQQREMIMKQYEGVRQAPAIAPEQVAAAQRRMMQEQLAQMKVESAAAACGVKVLGTPDGLGQELRAIRSQLSAYKPDQIVAPSEADFAAVRQALPATASQPRTR